MIADDIHESIAEMPSTGGRVLKEISNASFEIGQVNYNEQRLSNVALNLKSKIVSNAYDKFEAGNFVCVDYAGSLFSYLKKYHPETKPLVVVIVSLKAGHAVNAFFMDNKVYGVDPTSGSDPVEMRDFIIDFNYTSNAYYAHSTSYDFPLIPLTRPLSFSSMLNSYFQLPMSFGLNPYYLEEQPLWNDFLNDFQKLKDNSKENEWYYEDVWDDLIETRDHGGGGGGGPRLMM